MTHQMESTLPETILQLLSQPDGLTQMAEVMRILLNHAMYIERSQALAADPYQRCQERRGYANGFKPKTVNTRLGSIPLLIPQTRGVEFYPSALEKGLRSERALKIAIAEMYVQGVSTRKVAAVMEKMCGLNITSSQVSRAVKELDAEVSAWRERPLQEITYLILDAKYEKVRHNGSLISCAVLSAVGISPSGHRTVLGVSVSLSEAEIHWRDFLASLQQRGLFGVRLITSDSHAGLKAAIQARFPGVPWQRCQFHLQQNAGQFVPKTSMRPLLAEELRAVFDAKDRQDADRLLQDVVAKYQKSAPKLSAWLDDNVPESLTVFMLPAHHRKRLRTSNMLERTNKEIKRRTRVATLFPNEDSLLRLVSSVLMEISEQWETQKIYLRMDNTGAIT